MNMKTQNYILILLSIALVANIFAQNVEGADERYIRIGALQNHFTAYGSERAWNNSYYQGMIWPADYVKQDNSVIKRSWLAVQDFTDENNRHWEAYGVYFVLDAYVDLSLFPIELKQTAKFAAPTIIVDGNNLSSPFTADVDSINPAQIPDRIVTNIVNTSMGLTMTRRIYAFSQQYHDNYFIKEFTFQNTGNIDYDDEIELNNKLNGLRISWGIRYSGSREGAELIGDGQVWGKHTWVTKRGEDYPAHVGEQIIEGNIVDWLRCGFSWAGQTTNNDYDNIGAPDIFRNRNGRLASPQHVGIGILHVDNTAADSSDNPSQPAILGWHAGDTYPGLGDMSPGQEPNMIRLYNMLSGNAIDGKGGNERFDEIYEASNPDPFTVHDDGGGTNVWISYGPFDLEPGESITIVEAEAVNGLSRIMCEEIGRRWKRAYDDPNDNGPFTLPNGNTTQDKDTYKNAWVYTGKDSILKTFGRAQRNYDANFDIPQPPDPPPLFEVVSGGDRIILKWSPSESEGEPDFIGYKIFRATGKPDTTFQEIFACGKGTNNTLTHQYEDVTPIRGFSYYYYILSFNDGSNNNTNLNPTGELHSSRFYTKTTTPAYLRRSAGKNLSDIRIVPNPYYIGLSENFRFPEEPDKLMFYNIPGQCTIKIFTERGDLIKTIEHNDGSGDEAWTSTTNFRQVIASGLYIAYIETQDGKSIYKKFIIIR